VPIDDFIKELNLLEEVSVKVYREPGSSFVNLQAGKQRYEGLIPRLPFPLTNPNFVVFSRFNSGEWTDVCMIKDIRKLDEASLSALKGLLDELYFIPRITQVLNLTTTGDEFVWEVVTDKGRRRFSTRGRRNIMNYGDRLILIDVDSNVYTIDLNKLTDKRSRSFIERFL
jgi:ATP-binding cassette subfamily C protein